MSIFLNMMTFVILIAFSVKTFALESTDVLKVNILKVYDKNVLVLNRGAEDGIFKKDHIKVTSPDGFIARGICIKSSMMTSHWKIYRVVRPQLVSKDTNYNLLSINQSAIPKDLQNYTKVDFSPYYNDYSDKEATKGLKLQQERIAKYDLPTKIEQTDAFREEKKSGFRTFLEENLDEDDARRDLSNMQIDFFASPIAWQTRNKQQESHYGLRIHNIGLKYQYEINAIERSLSVTDPVSEESYNSRSTHYDLQFQVNRVTENVSLVSDVSYDKEKIGDIYYPRKNFQLGVIGARYHIWEKDPRDQFVDFTYTPVFDNFEYTEPVSGGLEQLIGVRHRMQLRLHSYFTPKVHNRTELTYSPFVSTAEGFEIDNSNIRTDIRTQFSWDLGSSFFFDYLAHYTKDSFRGDIYNINPENILQSVRLRYSVNL